MTWVTRTIRETDAGYEAAEGADRHHVVHEAIQLAANQRREIEVEADGVTLSVSRDSDPVVLLDEWGGAEKRADSKLASHTFDELYEMAQDQDISGRSNMSKDELIEALS